MFTTNTHKKYWQERKIDWDKSYLSGIDPVSGQPMWNHPHRDMLVQALRTIPFVSLWEVGCGAGANFYKFLHNFKGKQFNGSDVNPDAIEFCRKTFVGGRFKVESAENLLMSDNSVDVMLSDATLLYVGPGKIKKVLQELFRVTRNHILLCELHETNLWKRWLYRLYRGYNVYDYKKLLEELGAYDIQIVKIPKEMWPGEPWAKYGHVILAKLPKK